MEIIQAIEQQEAHQEKIICKGLRNQVREEIKKEQESQAEQIKLIVEQLNNLQAEQLKKEGYTNECFFNSDGTLTDEYKIKYKEKTKYFYIDFGSSGAFMVEKATGNIFNIKGYGQINKAKYRGNIKDIDVRELHKSRW